MAKHTQTIEQRKNKRCTFIENTKCDLTEITCEEIFGVCMAGKLVINYEHIMKLQRLFRKRIVLSLSESSQLAFTCSKLTRETLEQGVKYVQS